MPFRTNTVVEWLKIALPAVVVLIVGFVLTYQFVGPPLPTKIRIAAGVVGGSYHTFALKYAEFLKREGITLEVVETTGSTENLALLSQANSDIDVALVQTGLGGDGVPENMISLGSLYYEPLWVFYLKDQPFRHLNELAGRRIAAGKKGSGTHVFSAALLKANGIDDTTSTLVELDGTKAAEALLNNQVDVAMFVSGAKSSIISLLMSHPSVRLHSFSRTEAYTRNFRFLSQVSLPEGMIDLKTNNPPQNVDMIAPAAMLVTTKSLHPALIDLLLQAANDVHGPAGTFSKAGQFPSPEYCDIPVSKEARRYYTSGPPFLQRYLPFWLATLVARLKVMLLPFIVLLLPMTKIVPPIFQWRIRRRVVRWYTRLQEIDVLVRKEGMAELPRLLEEIKQMDEDVSQVSIPLGYADQLYNLRLHIDLVQGRIEKMLTSDQA